ncbi:MAG: ABC transporter ATP-binding protein, partial [Planctomycetes bacterium]|nr:ABC transporter ATP-binding protein [Planctomycetota bacterium]
AGATRRLLAYARPYARWMVLALTLIVLMSGLVNYLPVLIMKITDTCLLNKEATVDVRISRLGQLSLLYITFALIGHILRYGQGILTAWLGQRIIYDLRMAVYKKAMRLHQGHFDRTPVGALLTRVTSDIDRMQGFVTDGVVGTMADIFMLVSIMVYMVVLHWQVALALFTVLPILFTALHLINRKLRHANRMIRERQSSINTLLQEDIVGMTTIQLFNRQSSARHEFRERNTNLRSAYYDEVHWFSLYFPVIDGGQALAFILILGTGGWLLLNQSGVITLGVLVAFLTYIRDFFRPLGSLSDKAGLFQVAMASAERIFALLDTPEAITDPERALPPSQIQGAIAFDRVWFAYDKENWVIKDLSFQVEPGQIIAVVGATGAGKSTIINLIGRFYDVQKGAVTINSHDIRQFHKTHLRSRLGYVFQDPFVFAGTVADNISLLNPDLTRDDLIGAAKTVNAHAFISDMPEGYDTELNERGDGLSFGQKQLLCMARTLAQDPELLFVMDEATASVDTATEVLIQDALNKLMHNRTSIVIAHRLSTIRHAHQILVMRHGELIDSGTHNDLMQRGGYYKHLYELLRHSPEV